MSKAAWLSAPGLPALVCLGVLCAVTGLRNWSALPRPVLVGAFADVLLMNTALAIVAAPLAGVAAAGRTASAGRVAQRLVTLVLLFIGVSAALSVVGWGASSGALRAIAASHITLATGAMALASLGALLQRLFRDPLDAAASGLALALLITVGILLAGPAVTDAPRRLVDGALLASPLVTTAAAADIDILRNDVLYRVSPLAHVQTRYPEWYLATGVYLLFTALCLTGVKIASRNIVARPN